MSFILTVQQKPMSINHAYPTGKNGRRFLTTAGKTYKEIIAWEAKKAMGGKDILSGNLRLIISYTFPDKRTDMNNCHKLIIDALQKIVYENDHQIHEEHYYRFFDKKSPKFTIVVEKIDQ